MAYHGYITFIGQFASSFNNPTVLEIGVDKGQTLFPVTNYFTKICNDGQRQFLYTGVDILLRDHVKIASHYINDSNWASPSKTGLVQLIEGNSLEVMPKFIDNDVKYSTILIDGDHNYHTVNKELNFALDIVHDRGIIVCDDYDGEGGSQNEYFAEQQGFYNESEINENINNLITRELDSSSDKVGVKGAVDEFLQNNPEWGKYKFYTGAEPVVLYRKDRIELSTLVQDEYAQITWKFLE